jgi:hypothetical protein
LTDLEPFRPSKLWKQMPAARRLAAAQAFWQDEHSAEQHAEAVVLIAQHLKFRPKSAAALPSDKKSRYLASLAGVSDVLAGRLLVTYHLAEQRVMMARFLDALNVAHDDGLITEEEVKPPAPEALERAAEALAAEFPREDVDLYFATLVSQDPDTWAGLGKVLT